MGIQFIATSLFLQHDDVDATEDDGEEVDDGKWRPAALIMALLYKV